MRVPFSKTSNRAFKQNTLRVVPAFFLSRLTLLDEQAPLKCAPLEHEDGYIYKYSLRVFVCPSLLSKAGLARNAKQPQREPYCFRESHITSRVR